MVPFLIQYLGKNSSGHKCPFYGPTGSSLFSITIRIHNFSNNNNNSNKKIEIMSRKEHLIYYGTNILIQYCSQAH